MSLQEFPGRDKESHAQMNIPDLIDRFITCQSTLPCRSNQLYWFREGKEEFGYKQ